MIDRNVALAQVDKASETIVDRLETEIRTYLETHPDATDTAEGIAAWWIQGAPTRSAVEQALARLVASGELREIRIQTGIILYAKANS